MRTHLWVSFAALLLALPVAAERAPFQDTATPEASEAETAQDRCDALIEKAQTAHRAWIAEYQKAAEAAKAAGEEVAAFSWDDSPLGDFIPEFAAAADEYAGTDDAIPFLMWIATEVSWMDKDAATNAIETLCKVHIKSEALEPLASSLGQLSSIVGDKRANELLTVIEKESSLPVLRGYATFTLLADTLESSEMGSDEYESAKKRLQDAATAADDKRLTSQITKKIRIREAFGIGMVAPDIEGIDLDGTAFKLSDYEGKILFVDFWGDW